MCGQSNGWPTEIDFENLDITNTVGGRTDKGLGF